MLTREQIEEYRKWLAPNNVYHQGNDLCDMALAYLDAQASGAQSGTAAACQWVATSERLPELNVEVLVAFKETTLPATAQRVCFRTTAPGEYEWLWPKENDMDGEPLTVTHWMPLPAAPSEHERQQPASGTDDLSTEEAQLHERITDGTLAAANHTLRCEKERLQAALTELVRLKDLKERWTRETEVDFVWISESAREDCVTNQPLAWQAAREALKGSE